MPDRVELPERQTEGLADGTNTVENQQEGNQ